MELNRVQHVAVVGLGSIGRRHVRILKMLRPDLQITLVRSGKGPAWPEQQIAQRVVMTSAEAIRNLVPKLRLSLHRPHFMFTSTGMAQCWKTLAD